MPEHESGEWGPTTYSGAAEYANLGAPDSLESHVDDAPLKDEAVETVNSAPEQIDEKSFENLEHFALQFQYAAVELGSQMHDVVQRTSAEKAYYKQMTELLSGLNTRIYGLSNVSTSDMLLAELRYVTNYHQNAEENFNANTSRMRSGADSAEYDSRTAVSALGRDMPADPRQPKHTQLTGLAGQISGRDPQPAGEVSSDNKPKEGPSIEDITQDYAEDLRRTLMEPVEGLTASLDTASNDDATNRRQTNRALERFHEVIQGELAVYDRLGRDPDELQQIEYYFRNYFYDVEDQSSRADFDARGRSDTLRDYVSIANRKIASVAILLPQEKSPQPKVTGLQDLINA